MAVVGFRLWLSRTEGFYSRRAAGLRPAAAARGGRLVSSFSRAPDPACAPVPPKEHVELCGMAVVRHGSGRKPSCSAPPLATRAAACLAACSSTSPGASRAGSATGSCTPISRTHSTRSAHARHTLGKAHPLGAAGRGRKGHDGVRPRQEQERVLHDAPPGVSRGRRRHRQGPPGCC